MRRLGNRCYEPNGLIMGDLDGLKVVNDILGHEAGDALLKETARVLMKCFRSGDMLARIGVDEFAVLLPGADSITAEMARQRIVGLVAEHNRVKPGLSLSISLGIASTDDDNIELDDLFKQADDNMYREKMLRRQSARSAVVQTLMQVLDARDFITEGHAVRLQKIVAELAVSLELSERRTADLCILAQCHDIGKVGISDRILFKPGPLDASEMEEMRKHSEIGFKIANSAAILADIADLILKHHEWWNGAGYPLGLKGDEIPLECRIMAIADAYDVMTSGSALPKSQAARRGVKRAQTLCRYTVRPRSGDQIYWGIW